jgi:hypothetical protein
VEGVERTAGAPGSPPTRRPGALPAVVVARPGATRQLSEDGPLLLWREPQGGGVEGLLLDVTVCDGRFCTMRHVQGLRVGEDLHSSWFDAVLSLIRDLRRRVVARGAQFLAPAARAHPLGSNKEGSAVR